MNLQDAFEPDFTIEVKSLNPVKGAYNIIHRIKQALEDGGFKYLANDSDTVLFVKRR
jgi:hypothetical protein